MDPMARKDLTKRMLELNDVIAKLDPAIRAAAFEVLQPAYFEDAAAGAQSAPPGAAKAKAAVAPANRERFYARFEHTKPADNLLLICAWLYSQYGVHPISRTEIDEESSDAGLTIPTRPDNTMRYAKKDGKALFRQLGSGFQLTVSGEACLKQTYAVKKGNKPRPAAE